MEAPALWRRFADSDPAIELLAGPLLVLALLVPEAFIPKHVFRIHTRAAIGRTRGGRVAVRRRRWKST